MGLINYIKFRALYLLMAVCLAASAAPVRAQSPADSIAAADTTQMGSIDAGPVIITEESASSDEDGTTVAAADQVVDQSDVHKTMYYYILLFILFCISVGIIGKVLRVYELTREVQGQKTGINWNRVQAILFFAFLVAGLYGTYWTYDYWGNIATAEAASEHGERLDLMMYITIAITTFVFVVTQILLFGFAFKYRGSSERKAYYYPHNNAVERLWTIVPAIVLTALVVFGFFTWRSITNPPADESRNVLNLEVTGEQFKWNVRYAGEDNKLGLRNYKLTTPTNSLGIDFTKRESWDDKLGPEIVLPVGRPVRVTINSKDILHSFYLPEFRVQMNAVPGMPTYFQFTPKFTTEEMKEKTNNPTFKYTLLCAKICGAGHYNMQYVVRVVSEDEYKEWIAKQPLFFNDDMKKELKMAGAAPELNKIAKN
jgi:cytochrome c oxidase subunit II